MSSPLAIGAVSAVLRNLLDNGMIELGGSLGTTVLVTAVAPDTIDLDAADDPPRINLFLHQVTPNAGWRNVGLPSRNINGERLSNPPLALDLHFLVTAYGRSDFQAEILLGYAMHLLHERPVLDRAAIRRALDPSPLDISMLPPAFQALAASDLADQVEMLKITPSAMSLDEMSKLWSAIQTHYRPSAAYQVSVVLIEAAHPAHAALPVLSRGPVDLVTGRDAGVRVAADLLPPLPTLFAVEPPDRQPGARLGETVTLRGVHLAGTGARVRLNHRLLAAPIEINVTPADDGRSVDFVLPNDAAAQADWPAGVWRLSLLLTPDGEPDERETNALPMLLAPAPVIAADAPLGLPAASVTREAGPPLVRVILASRPQVWLEQPAVLMLNSVQANALVRDDASDPLEFEFPDTLPALPHWVRLRVDGVDSELLVRTGLVPAFDPAQRVAVPA